MTKWWLDIHPDIEGEEHMAMEDKELIKLLADALEIVRDADADCIADDLPGHRIPEMVRAQIDEALDLAGRPSRRKSDAIAAAGGGK